MPLLTGKKNIGRNISELIRSGRERDQSVAIALDYARKHGTNVPKKRKGRKHKKY